MAEDSIPIWQVIEEFKEKIKTQEADIKRRREELDSLESKLRAEEKSLAESRSRMEAKENDLHRRETDLQPREQRVSKLQTDLSRAQSDMRAREDELQASREDVEKRQAQVVKQESELLRLTELTAAHEMALRQASERSSKAEERVLAEEADLKRIVESMTSKREELLTKIKMVEEQIDLLANSKTSMLEEKRRLVEWERTLGERERAVSVRETTERWEAPAIEAPSPAAEPVEEVLQEDNAAKMESSVEEEPSMHSVPAPSDAAGNAEQAPVPEPAPEEISPAAIDDSPVAPVNPEPGSAEEPKHEPEPAPEEHHEELRKPEVKKSVSIRKIIKKK